MGQISSEARRELVKAVTERYQASGRVEKLSGAGNAQNGCPRRGVVARVYDEAVREAIIVLWEASDRICGKRLKPLVPVLVSALERHGHLELDDQVRSKLLSVSAATIDRLLSPTREAAGSRRRSVRKPPAVRASVPVRTFGDWNEPSPGYVEADLVAHCGGSMAGSVAHTLVLTDIASGWTECVALAVKEGGLVVEALRNLQTSMPFPLRGVDTDNGGEFINETMVSFCKENGIEFTRSRPYRKNDQAWVEQKNGSVVRRLVGHRRLEGIAGAQALSRLYGASRLFVNFFQPSFKLLDKHRVGARVSKRYRTPETPCARLLGSGAVDDDMKQRLRAMMVTLDPLKLLDEIRTVQHHLVGLSNGQDLHMLPHRDADLDRFLRSLATAWREGEIRPTHQRAPKPKRHWRTREDPFEKVWPDLLLWLEQEPDRTAKELFGRLQLEHPGTFPNGQLRTLQRRVKDWRRAAARRLIFSTAATDSQLH